MELFISFLLIAFYLLFFSINFNKLNQAFTVFSSILFLVIGVLVLFQGSDIFSTESIETYTYNAGEISNIETSLVPNTSGFIEILGLFSILSAIYLFLFGAMNKE